MKLTPLDIHQKEFRHVLRGYNEEEVDSFLDEVANEFERLFQENIDLKEQVERLQKKLTQYENFEQTLQDTMIAAQKSAEDIQNNAKRAGELIIRDAELKAKEKLQESASQRQKFETEFAALKKSVDDFRSQVEAVLKDYLKKLAEIEKAESKLPEELLVAVSQEAPAEAIEETVIEQEELVEQQEPVAEEVIETTEPEGISSDETAGEVDMGEEQAGSTDAVLEETVTETIEQNVEQQTAVSNEDTLKEAMRKLKEEAEAFSAIDEPSPDELTEAPAEETATETSSGTSTEEASSDIEEIS